MKSEKDIHFRSVPLILAVSAIALLVTACVARLSSNVSQAQPESAWVLLQQGDPGYVVMMRHDTTHQAQEIRLNLGLETVPPSATCLLGVGSRQ